MRATQGKVRLYRVRLDQGGYEVGSGQYWGTGMPLYRAEDEEGHLATVRAINRGQAALQIQKHHREPIKWAIGTCPALVGALRVCEGCGKCTR